MTETNEDLKRRVTVLEINQSNLVDTQERIIYDLKETSESLKKISIDIGILVGTVKSLADTIAKQDDFVNQAHKLEVSVQKVIQKSEVIDNLEKKVYELETKSSNNSLITKALTFVAGSVTLIVIGIMVNNVLL